MKKHEKLITIVLIVWSIIMLSQSVGAISRNSINKYYTTIEEIEFEKKEIKIQEKIKVEEKKKVVIPKNKKKDLYERKVIATVYNPVESQCDSDPLITADNSKICLNKLNKGKLRWIAVSRDLRKYYKYGTKVILRSESFPEINGEWEVHDTMHPRYKNSIDLLMPIGIKKGKWHDVIITKK